MQKQKTELEKEKEFPETGFSGVVDNVGSRAVEMGVMGHNLEGKHNEFLEKASPWKGEEHSSVQAEVEMAEKKLEHHTGFRHPFHKGEKDEDHAEAVAEGV